MSTTWSAALRSTQLRQVQDMCQKLYKHVISGIVMFTTSNTVTIASGVGGIAVIASGVSALQEQSLRGCVLLGESGVSSENS